ncbi:MAG: hypothetical protein WC468_00655, partial [Candidatus Paceibacterota bacterium]
MAFLSGLFGSANEKYIKGLEPLIKKINSLEAELVGLNKEQIRLKTEELKERLKKGETTDDI